MSDQARCRLLGVSTVRRIRARSSLQALNQADPRWGTVNRPPWRSRHPGTQGRPERRGER